jgi:hypothetical protein
MFILDVPARDYGIIGHGGAEMGQLYCGTFVTAVFPRKNELYIPASLLDFTHKLGATNGLFNANTKFQIGKTIQSIICNVLHSSHAK